MSRISLEEALMRMCEHRDVVGCESISIYESVGRVLAEDLVAQLTQPPFPRSAMDGYALRYEDALGASKEHPVTLKVQGKLCAGDAPMELQGTGQAIRIMTGGSIPYGADCVIRQEDTDYGEDMVEIYAEGSKNQNCSPAGEDFMEGEILAKAGDVIDAYTVAIAAANGIEYLSVRKKVKVAVISSGSELRSPGMELAPGKIYDSNRAYMVSRCMQLGCEIVYGDTIGDVEEELIAAIEKGVALADVVITTGGVSVGQKDLIPEIVKNHEDTEVLFHGINVKPGMPTLCAKIKDCMFLGLSGNPYSAAAIFELIGIPLLNRLQGKTEYMHPVRTAKIMDTFKKRRPCVRILRGYYDGEKVNASMMQKNSQIKAGIGSNCLVELPAGEEEIRMDDNVKIYLIPCTR